jgi:hypothetical protein
LSSLLFRYAGGFAIVLNMALTVISWLAGLIKAIFEKTNEKTLSDTKLFLDVGEHIEMDFPPFVLSVRTLSPCAHEIIHLAWLAVFSANALLFRGSVPPRSHVFLWGAL